MAGAFRNLVLPVVVTSKHVVPIMRRNDTGGAIINTGSFLAGMGAATAQTAFSAAKAAVIQISRDLGIHLAKSGIRVNSLSIGPVETPQSRAMFEAVGAEGLALRLAHVPTGRFATPEEIAGTAVFLASADAAYITGADLIVDGGIRGAYTIPGYAPIRVSRQRPWVASWNPVRGGRPQTAQSSAFLTLE